MSTKLYKTTKTLTAQLGLVVLSVMSLQAHAFLVDSSTQQKTIYIGKGDGQHMQAVQVQNIPNPQLQTNVRTYVQQTPAQQPSVVAHNDTYVLPHYNQQNHTQSYDYGMGKLAVTTNSKAAAVFDLQTGQLIYQKNIDARRSIASISKVMTAMVLLDSGMDMNEQITLIPSDFVGAKNSPSKNLKVGDTMSRSEFMLLMLMKSENPAAKALARTYTGGYDAFIAAMNHKAYTLGMYQTSFSDSSGLDPRNVSSVSDLIKMMQVISANPYYQPIRSFSTAASYEFGINNYNSGYRVYKANNTNRLVRSGDYPIGVSKTGFIREAGYCVVMETHVNNRPAIVVLLGADISNNRWNDAENILTELAYRN